jgi:hypothetical protein
MTSITAAVWRSEVANVATFVALMRALPTMGRFVSLDDGFRPEVAAETFDEVFYRVERVRVGRDEVSLAMDFELPSRRSQMPDWDGRVEQDRNLDGLERAGLADLVLAWAAQLGATGVAVEQEREGNARQVLYGAAGARPTSVTARWN